ncbi:hypothetical protein ACW9ID_22470 [Pseudomonas gingeri]|uniref:hypothetical protein n=1 Tax=Pseudomonas sp. Ost2 TaxID=2678260 RepID=UPI001BB33BD5|nr:hypothetical protein [Pseudomonas sp. Ost2]
MNVTTRRNPSLPFNNFMNCPQTLGNTSLEQRLKSAVKKTVFFATDFPGVPRSTHQQRSLSSAA